MKGNFFGFILGAFNKLKLLLASRRRGDIFYIGGSESLPPPLSAEEESNCIQALGRGEAGARSKLIEHNLRLVVYIAKKYGRDGGGPYFDRRYRPYKGC